MTERTATPDQRVLSLPPRRGLSLGWRLALSTALIISLVMGSISVGQQIVELREERQLHQELLQMSLAPLAVRLEAATNLNTVRKEIDLFHMAYSNKGFPIHEVVLLDAANKEVLSTRVPPEGGDDAYLQATIPLNSPLLDGGKGFLMVLKNSEGYRNAVHRDWLLWAIHFTVTVGVVFLFLAAVIHFQVTKPINRLVEGVKKMEKGYWRPIALAGGAWEIRWLAWRFSNMVQEVDNSLTHLFEAEKKAQSQILTRSGSPQAEIIDQPSKPAITPCDQTQSTSYRKLLKICERLEAASPDDLQAVQIGRSVWQYETLEASRLGFYEIKVRLEDAALHLIEPDAYRNLDDRISELKSSWKVWADLCRVGLYRLLEDSAIPCAGVLHRVKHTASVWSKMLNKGLELGEIYDLFAFRIIVPTEADCYAALGIVHRFYRPEVGRFKDYITKPKENGYRGLHTCVRDRNGPIFEVQIRSVAMDRQADRGDAAHWLYKKHGRETNKGYVKRHWWERLRFNNWL